MLHVGRAITLTPPFQWPGSAHELVPGAPRDQAAESSGDLGTRLALREDAKSLPWGAVWEEFCRRQNAPLDGEWISSAQAYEADVLALRM